MYLVPVVEGSAAVAAIAAINVWVWLGGRRPKTKPSARRADPLRIAELEWELFGIEPAPGSAAAFAIGLRQAVRGTPPDAVITMPETMSRYDAAEFAAQYARRAPASRTTVLAHGPDHWDVSSRPG